MSAPPGAVLSERSFLVMGAGVTGRAVIEALTRRNLDVVVADDRPAPEAVALCERLGVELADAPDADRLRSLLGGVDALLPAPGLPDRHPAMLLSAELGVPVLGELDLAAAWDGRPIAAVTGTNGKTTVTTLVADMLEAGGVPTALAGNTDVPLVAAIDDPRPEVFVVEASSFRLGHSRHVAPKVGAWLNFAPDHLDVHASIEAYEAAKARIWAQQDPSQVAVANLGDPVVRRHATGPARVRGYVDHDPGVEGYAGSPDAFVRGRELVVDDEVLLGAGDLWSALAHDRGNVLAATLVATAAGASRAAAAEAARDFGGLAHRVQLVARADGVRWYDDSKATAPHATASAVRSFDSVVLIAGGRNKGLDLAVLGELRTHVRAVVGIGEAAFDVVDAFEGAPTVVATSMRDAVTAAAAAALPGDVVLLSPGCASFDWYRSYAERGDDFTREVRRRLGDMP